MTAKRLRRAAANDPGQFAKLFQVQEAQIADLQAKLAVTEAVLVGVVELYVYDHVDPQTGEVLKGYQLEKEARP